MNQDAMEDINCGLNTALEQLHAVIHSVNDGRPCSQIICQIEAVRKSLRNLRRLMIIGQISKSMSVIQNDSDANVRLCELARLQELYSEKFKHN